MRAAYTCTIQPTAEPISVADALDHAHADNESQLVRMQGYVLSARERVEALTGRALMTQTWVKTSRTFAHLRESNCGRIILLERTPVASVTSVKYYPEGGGAQVTLAPEAYTTFFPQNSAGMIELAEGQSWPSTANRIDAVQIEFVAGVSDPSRVPHELRNAIAIIAGHNFTVGRDEVVTGTIVTKIPNGADDMIARNRVGGWVE